MLQSNVSIKFKDREVENPLLRFLFGGAMVIVRAADSSVRDPQGICHDRRCCVHRCPSALGAAPSGPERFHTRFARQRGDQHQVQQQRLSQAETSVIPQTLDTRYPKEVTNVFADFDLWFGSCDR